VTVFLREPEYLFGCLGFIIARTCRRGIISLGAAFSALAAVLALTLLLLHHSTPTLVGQMIFLVVCAWVFVFGLFRLFWTGMMWVFDNIADLFRDAMPGLTKPLNYIYLGYWIFFEIWFTLGFIFLLVYALLLPFGVVQPL
jgi:hypothetical protein